MTIDIRAKVYCSLGPVISGSFADDFLQDSGLIKTRGEVVLAGIFKPAIGTVVEFAYIKGGIASRLPRKLRVLSVFADPYRKTTTIALGCKLTYLDGRKPPPENLLSEDENGPTPIEVIDIASLPISASYIFDQCLSAIGLTATRNPLTNKFSVEEFSLDSGYITVISDLLKSEGYFGYINESEVLVVEDFDTDAGTGPLVTPDKLIDLSPIDAGELPGDDVIVNYSFQRLKAPEEDPVVDGEGNDVVREGATSITTGSEVTVSITGTVEGTGQEVTVSSSYTPVSSSREIYGAITVYDPEKKRYKRKYVVQQSLSSQNGSILEAAGGYVTAAIQTGNGSTGFSGTYEKTSATSYFYDNQGRNIGSVTTESQPGFVTNLATPVPWGDVLKVSIQSPPGVTIGGGAISKTSTSSSVDERQGITQTSTTTYKAKVYTTAGQNEYGRLADAALAEADPETRRGNLIFLPIRMASSAGDLIFESSSNTFQTGDPTDPLGSLNPPDKKDLLQESSSGFEVVSGTSESQLIIEFSLPYASDDYISDEGEIELLNYKIKLSDAAIKAKNYGKIQNRLLLGNRNGVSIQIPVELLPEKPFAPIYLDAAGFVGQFRVNGANYTFDANGIIGSVDALFWGGVGAS